MKNIFLYLLIFISFSEAVAQKNFCGTKGLEKYKQTEYNKLKSQKTFTEFNSLPNLNKTLSVTVHIFIDKKSGIANTKPNDILSNFNDLNVAFAPVGLSFNICKFDTIENYQYYTVTALPDDPEMMGDSTLINMYYKPNTINIYYVWFADDANLLGYTYLPGYKDVIFLDRKCDSYTLIHEMGHFFGLLHTFQTGDENIARIGATSNCKTAGDGLCDTEADPFLKITDKDVYYDSECHILNNPQKDILGEFYLHPTDNYMSYYEVTCGQIFTPEQYQLIAQGYLTYKQHLW